MLGRYTSGFRFGGRRIFREGSTSTRSSASAHPKNECRTEITFDRVLAFASRQRFRKCRRSAVVSSPIPTSGKSSDSFTKIRQYESMDRGYVTLDPPPVQERVYCPLDPHPASLFSMTSHVGSTARRTKSWCSASSKRRRNPASNDASTADTFSAVPGTAPHSCRAVAPSWRRGRCTPGSSLE